VAPTTERPKVAVLATSYFYGSHADVIATRLIEGYPWHGEHREARLEVVALYLEQRNAQLIDGGLRPDIGVEIAERNGVPILPTVGETLACGGTGIAVDGVIIVGEHGAYELNEFGQQLYPRRRLFDAAVAAMVAAGRCVPIVNDKGLAYAADDALAMVGTARRLGIPLVAGSTIPLSWHVPTEAQWPWDAPLSDVVAVGFGPAERYGFHTLEGMQAFAERRRGGERGVVAVTAYGPQQAARACRDGVVDADLLDEALTTFGLDADGTASVIDSADAVYVVEYADGLRATAVQCQDPAIRSWAVAGRGPDDRVAYQIYVPGASPDPTDHFILFVRQMESLVLTGVEPSPPERTVLTTCVLDAAMHSLHDGGHGPYDGIVRIETPRIAELAYQAVESIADSGVGHVYPEPARRADTVP